ncbi:MAG: hypothetical protein ACO25B_13805 [Chitinophagaceae bacterium]
MWIISRKIGSAFLLALVLAPLFYTFILQAKQLSIQHRMKYRIERSLLHSIVLKKDELHWVKPGKEIRVGEKLFDIKTMQDSDHGMVLVTGLFDNEETFIYQAMKRSRENDTKRNNHLVIQLLQTQQALPETQQEPTALTGILRGQKTIFNTPSLPSPFKGIRTPPPQTGLLFLL